MLRASLLQGRSFLRSYTSEVGKSLLGTLRRRTGFPIIKCKEALVENENDLDAAERWLNEQALKEGWADVARVQHRQAKQGLIGVAVDGNKAAMVEVNCETDFVARTEKFQSLVSTVTQKTLQELVPKLLATTTLPSIDRLTMDSITNIMDRESGRSVGDLAAEVVAHLKENLVVSRGCTICCTSGLICSHVYKNRSLPDSDVKMGTYGALLHLSAIDPGSAGSDMDTAGLKELGERICQQVVGMNPEGVEGGEGALVNQTFLFDELVTVGDLLRKSGVRVTNFVRYALGEKDVDPTTVL